MQCSKLNTHSSKCMILLECLHDQLRSRVLTNSLSHSPKPRMRIIVLLVDNLPMYIYIYIYIYQLGRLRRLIFFNLDYPPIINIFRQPSEPFSLDSSHVLTPIVLRCFGAYGMHVCQFQYSQIHMQIYKHEYIHIEIKSHNHVM